MMPDKWIVFSTPSSPHESPIKRAYIDGWPIRTDASMPKDEIWLETPTGRIRALGLQVSEGEKE